MNMRLARSIAKALLVFCFLLDSGIAWQLWRYGPPMVATDVREIKPGEVSFRMTRLPLSHSDYFALIIMIALHAILITFLWRSRRKIIQEQRQSGPSNMLP